MTEASGWEPGVPAGGATTCFDMVVRLKTHRPLGLTTPGSAHTQPAEVGH